MNAKIPFLALFFVGTLPAPADEPASDTDFSASSSPTAVMQANPYHMNLQELLTQKPKSSALRLANSDFVISSPIIEGLRPNAETPNRPPLWKRILLLPVRLVTPLKMPWPPGGGRYFKWSERSSRPWMSVSEGNVGNDTLNLINSEPKSALISAGTQ